MYRSKFVPIATAIEQVGGHPALLKALRDAYVRAQGRLIAEGDERARAPTPIEVSDWLDYTFDKKKFTLNWIETDASGASTQLRYVDIKIRRADLEKLVPKGRPPAKPGRHQHQAKAPMMDELARWERAEQPTFKNRSELSRELIKWYEKAHGANTGPEISRVLTWLRDDRKDNRWQVLVK
jgi:hypothetical protein